VGKFLPQSFSYLQGSNCVVSSNVIAGPNPLVFSDVAFSTVAVQGNTVHMTHAGSDWGDVFERPGTTGAWTVNNNHYTAVSPNSVAFNDATFGQDTFAQWKSNHPTFDTASTSTNGAVPPDQYFVIPNQDQSKRGHIAVYNFSHANNVTVNVSSVLSTGDTYQLISAMDYASGVIKSGTLSGSTISIPMTNLTAAPVLYGTNFVGTGNHSGYKLTNPPVFTPEFGAFVLIGASGTSSDPIIRITP
jgi:hypothetical protein